MEQIKRNQIRYADLGYKEDTREQSGVRPVLIVQNNTGNKYSPTVIIVPLSASKDDYYPFHVRISNEEYNIKKESTILCEQPRVLDKKFIGDYLDDLKDEHIELVDKALKLTLAI